MFCPNCRREINLNSETCPFCNFKIKYDIENTRFNIDNYRYPNTYSQSSNKNFLSDKPIPSYLIWSILCTIFCCLPCGIVALVYSNKVNRALSINDFSTAHQASKTAKVWNTVGTIIGVVFNILFIITIIGILLSIFFPN